MPPMGFYGGNKFPKKTNTEGYQGNKTQNTNEEGVVQIENNMNNNNNEISQPVEITEQNN
jgi:hypothetical protein